MKTDKDENKRVSGTLTLLLLIILSLLIHLLFFGTFLQYGFQSRTKKFFARISGYLTPSQKQEIQERTEKKHAAIKRIFQTSSQKRKEKSFLFNKQKQQDTRPAKLVAPKSNFGWVIFDDQHQQPDKLEIPNTKQGEIETSQHARATMVKPENKTKKTTPLKPTIKPESQALPKKLEAKKVETKTEFKAEIKQKTEMAKLGAVNIVDNEPIEPTKKTESPAPEIKSQEEIQKRIEEIEKKQKQIDNYASQEPQKVATETPQEQPREMTKEEEKNMILNSILRKDKNTDADHDNPGSSVVWGAGGKKNDSKNLIKLTKGYIEKLRGESGTDLIDRDGDPNKRPSFEELKYISYESKINWCLQSSWKNNFAHNQVFHTLESKAVIEFTIDESGKVVSSSMLQSTGHRDVDTAILKNLEFASPFPPIPKHFGTKTYTTGRSITVYAQRFGL